MRTRIGLISLLLSLTLVAAACGGGGGGGQGGGGATEVRPAIVLVVCSLGNQSFNDSAVAGLKREQKEFDVETETLESSSPTD